ncbi:hypothetical protein GGX14DRAFT_344985, partial [Mycena pura]
IAPSTQLAAFYKKAYTWPSRPGEISITDIKDTDEAVAIDFADDGPDPQGTPVNLTYTVYYGILEVLDALYMPQQSTGEVLVVRDEYLLLRTNLEERFAKKPRYWAVVVTGHPGIGKTMFLIYLLLYRLEHKRPTAVQVTSDLYYIFDERGVTAFRLDQYSSRLPGCWALVDSNQYVIVPCAPLTSRAKYVVLTTPPEPKRWKAWLKQGGGELMVSELPATLEIAAIAKELGLDPKVARRWAEKRGQSMRQIIELLEAEEGYETKVETDAETASDAVWASPQKLSTMLSDVQSLSSTGSAVVFLRPVMKHDHRLPGIARDRPPGGYL